jgi:predicted nucleic acid-binding protein
MSESAATERIAFVDASALVALADRDDASHEASAAAYEDFLHSGFLLFTTDLAFATAHQLILAALGPSTARTWLAQCAIHIEPVTAQDLEEGRRAVEPGNVPPSAPLCDAIHLAVLDRLNVTDVFAVDRQFLGILGG